MFCTVFPRQSLNSHQLTRANMHVIGLAWFLSFSGAHSTPALAETPSMASDPHAKRHVAAIAEARQRLARKADRLHSSDWVNLGDAQLRSGKATESIVSFEKAIELSPDVRPHLWQYGIALFFAGRHSEGRDLFVEHRLVNPNDVENAAWHFLCAAKATKPDDARKILLPAPNDPRVPMNEILLRLAGGDDKKILLAVEGQTDSRSKANARFYADLYLGLVADAEGGQELAAKRWMAAAAKSKATHYMADVARVYSSLLQMKANTEALDTE